MVFPGAGELPRHPTQLYEAGLEGLLLFLVLWTYSRKPRPLGAVSGLFAVGYSLARITVEFFRMPDPQMGYLYGGWLTMGQVLCLPLLFAGLCLLCYAWSQYKNPSRERVELEDGSVIYIRRRLEHSAHETRCGVERGGIHPLQRNARAGPSARLKSGAALSAAARRTRYILTDTRL